MSGGARLRVALGLAAGGAALWLAIRGIDGAALWVSLVAARPVWTAIAALSVVTTLATNVVRWRLLLGDGAPWRPVAEGLLIGQMLNIVLPLRLGEIARSVIVSRALAVPAGRVLTTIAVEKLGELTAVGLTACVLLAFATLPDGVRAGGGVLVLTGLLAAITAVIATQPPAVLRGLLLRGIHKTKGVVPDSWRPRLDRQFAAAAEGLSALQSRTRSVEFWTLSMLIVLMAASTNYFLFFAFDLRLPAFAALTLLLSLQVGTTLVSVPGNLGVFHYVVLLVLAAHGVDRTTALAYAMLLYAVAILPKVVVGGLLLVFGYRWATSPLQDAGLDGKW